MLVKTQGIVLKSVKYSETSLILDILTEELGLKTYIISGVRKKNAKISAGILQSMNILNLVVYNKEGTNINRIKEVKIEYIYKNLPFDIKKYSISLFLIEMISKSIKEKEPNKEFFDFVKNSLIYLDQTHNNISVFHIIFLLKMSRFTGFHPVSNYSVQNRIFDLREGKFKKDIPFHKDYLAEQESFYFSKFLNSDLEKNIDISIDREKKQKLLHALILYYKIHLSDFGKVKTIEIFKKVFDSY